MGGEEKKVSLQKDTAVVLLKVHQHLRLWPKMPSTYKKDKPWDTDDIDKWEVSESVTEIYTVSSLICDRSNPSKLMIMPAVASQRSLRS